MQPLDPLKHRIDDSHRRSGMGNPRGYGRRFLFRRHRQQGLKQALQSLLNPAGFQQADISSFRTSPQRLHRVFYDFRNTAKAVHSPEPGQGTDAFGFVVVILVISVGSRQGNAQPVLPRKAFFCLLQIRMGLNGKRLCRGQHLEEIGKLSAEFPPQLLPQHISPDALQSPEAATPISRHGKPATGPWGAPPSTARPGGMPVAGCPRSSGMAVSDPQA